MELRKISQFPNSAFASDQKYLVELSDGTYAYVLGSEISGGGISGTGTVSYIPKIATVDGVDILTLEDSHIYSDELSVNGTIVSEFGQIDWNVEGTNGTSTLQVKENEVSLLNTPTFGITSKLQLNNGEAIIETTSIPASSVGFVTIDATGKLGFTASGGGGVTSVSGTTNRITSTGGATPVIDISASYVGQSSITTLGTITTGVWNGTAIANANLANSSVTINGTSVSLGASGTVTAAAGTLTGTTLNATVVSSSLTSVGTLSSGAIPASLVTAGTFGSGAYVMDTSLRVPNLIGSASASGTLTINSTSSGTKGFVYLGSSTGFSYDETNKRVGLGVASPTDILDVAGTVAGNLGILFRNSSTTGYTRMRVTNSNVGDYLQLTAYGTGVTPYGMVGAGEMNIYSTKNLNILTDVASGIIKFATGTGATERWRMSGEGFTNTAGTPTAYIHLKGGTATASTAPLKFTSGTNLTTAENGAMEYNGTNLFFTRAGGVREGVLTQSAVTTEVVVSDTTVTVNIGGVTYKLLARA